MIIYTSLTVAGPTIFFPLLILTVTDSESISVICSGFKHEKTLCLWTMVPALKSLQDGFTLLSLASWSSNILINYCRLKSFKSPQRCGSWRLVAISEIMMRAERTFRIQLMVSGSCWQMLRMYDCTAWISSRIYQMIFLRYSSEKACQPVKFIVIIRFQRVSTCKSARFRQNSISQQSSLQTQKTKIGKYLNLQTILMVFIGIKDYFSYLNSFISCSGCCCDISQNYLRSLCSIGFVFENSQIFFLNSLNTACLIQINASSVSMSDSIKLSLELLLESLEFSMATADILEIYPVIRLRPVKSLSCYQSAQTSSYLIWDISSSILSTILCIGSLLNVNISFEVGLNRWNLYNTQLLNRLFIMIMCTVKRIRSSLNETYLAVSFNVKKRITMLFTPFIEPKMLSRICQRGISQRVFLASIFVTNRITALIKMWIAQIIRMFIKLLKVSDSFWQSIQPRSRQTTITIQLLIILTSLQLYFSSLPDLYLTMSTIPSTVTAISPLTFKCISQTQKQTTTTMASNTDLSSIIQALNLLNTQNTAMDTNTPPSISLADLKINSVECRSVQLCIYSNIRQQLRPIPTFKIDSPCTTFWKTSFSGMRWMMLYIAKESVAITIVLKQLASNQLKVSVEARMRVIIRTWTRQQIVANINDGMRERLKMYSFTLMTQNNKGCTIAQHAHRKQKDHYRGVLADLQGVDAGVLYSCYPLRIETEEYTHQNEAWQCEYRLFYDECRQKGVYDSYPECRVFVLPSKHL